MVVLADGRILKEDRDPRTGGRRSRSRRGEYVLENARKGDSTAC